MPIDSPLNSPSPGCFFCCFDYGSEPIPLFFCRFNKSRDQHLKNLSANKDCQTKFCRIGLFLMHFASYYFILYPFILLLGMIPFIGAVTSFVLIFFAFLVSLISYFLILITAWIFSRPVFAILLIIGTIGLITLIALLRKNDGNGKHTWGKRFENQGNYGNNYNNNGYNDRYGENYSKKNFLKF